MSLLLYNFFLLSYTAALRLAATWNPKARLWVNGRKNWQMSVSGLHSGTPTPAQTGDSLLTTHHSSLTPTHSPLPGPHSPVIWMHCASLGEFEQGRPVLEAVKERFPTHKIVLTFFSPSGYEIRKNYIGADLVLYLPMDGPNTAREFIEAIRPALVLWVKYEYWYYYLLELKKRDIPVLLISGIFRESQPFFKWYGGIWKKILANFDQLFVQTENSATLLREIGIKENITVSGDTRFDRVIAIAGQWEKLAEPVEQFCEGHQVIVAGSTWEEDEEELIHYAKAYPQIRFIFVPHEVSKARIQELQQEFPEALLYSALINRQLSTVIHSNVLIIDTIGILSRLYKYATVAYIGGGFNESGIHNVLEAAVYGKPVIFGPEYEKFAEAVELVDTGGAFSIENALQLESLLNNLLNDKEALEKCEVICRTYVQEHQGATGLILDYIQRKRLLIN